MRFRPGAEISKILSGWMIPLCIWGLVSSLILQLIDIRAVFIAGGEGRLRQAALAFTGGVIFLQRLRHIQGKTDAKPYAFALGASILAFCGYFSFTFRIPLHPIFVFIINTALFSLLWWSAYKITEACSVDTGDARDADLSSGILSKRKMIAEKVKKSKKSAKEIEEEWVQRLPKAHPGRVILYFSLIAAPVFGAGFYFFNLAEPTAKFRLGMLIFIYLWCAFALLLLSSLTQLRFYFEKRDVSLPETIGIAWLSSGMLIITVVMILAFFLPQPASFPTLFVRDQIVSIYKGWESKYGVKDPAYGKTGSGKSGDSSKSGDDIQSLREHFDKRYENVDKIGDKYLSDAQRKSGFEQDYKNVLVLSKATKDSFREVFQGFLKLIFLILILAGAVVLYLIAMAIISGIGSGFGSFSLFRKKKLLNNIKKKREILPPETIAAVIKKYPDPFLSGYKARDGHALVRYMWEAMTDFSGMSGYPWQKSQTPREYVSEEPPPLKGFEDEARFIAEKYIYSEFSGKPFPENEIPRLKEFWINLQDHISAAGQ